MSRETLKADLRCPFVAGTAAYLLVVFAEGLLAPTLARTLHFASLRSPVIAVVTASVVSAIVFARVSRNAQNCTWLPFSRTRGFLLFFLEIVVGLFVVFPALSFGQGILIPFHLLGIVGIASLAAYLGLHLQSHRNEGGQFSSRAKRFLRAVSTLPFLLLWMTLIAVIILTLGEILASNR